MSYLSIKTKIRKILPTRMFELLIRIWRDVYCIVDRDHRIKRRLLKKYVSANGWVVSGGTFKGLLYLESAVGSELLPKLLGTYECELEGVISKYISKKIKTVIDIGCAEGYYLAGFGKKNPHIDLLVGIDILEESLHETQKLLDLNKIGIRAHLTSQSSIETLRKFDLEDSLIICDCEGFEKELLDPVKIIGLRKANIIVETHEFIHKDIVFILRKRFRKTHKIKIIQTMKREPSKNTFLKANLKVDEYKYLEYERGDKNQKWLIIERR